MNLCEPILWKLEGNSQEDKERIQDFRVKVLEMPHQQNTTTYVRKTLYLSKLLDHRETFLDNFRMVVREVSVKF